MNQRTKIDWEGIAREAVQGDLGRLADLVAKHTRELPPTPPPGSKCDLWITDAVTPWQCAAPGGAKYVCAACGRNICFAHRARTWDPATRNYLIHDALCIECDKREQPKRMYQGKAQL